MREVLCWMPGYEPYHTADDRTEIRTGAWRGEVYSLRSDSALVHTVIRQIDGHRTRTEILELLPQEQRPSGESLLDDLLAGGLVQARSVPDNWSGPDGVRRFLLTLPTAGRNIAGYKVLLIGLGVFGSRIATGLAQLGIGQISLADDSRIGREDRAMNMPYATAREGAGRATHLRRFLSRHWPHTSCRAVRLPSADRGLRVLVSEHDLVICALDRPVRTIASSVNDACLQAGMPWLQVSSDSLLVAVGPLFLPGETGCFQCWEASLGSAMTPAQRRDSGRFQLQRPGGEVYVGTPGTADLAAGLLLSDIPFMAHGLSRFPGRYITIDLLTQAMDLCEAPKLPRCPSCGSRRPVS